MKVLIATYQSAFFVLRRGTAILRTYDAMKEYNIDVELFDYYNTERYLSMTHIFFSYGLVLHQWPKTPKEDCRFTTLAKEYYPIHMNTIE